MSMMNTFIIHRVAPEDVSFVKRVTGGLPPELERRLTKLETGTVIITSRVPIVSFPVLVKIPRRKIESEIGATYVTSFLKEQA